MVVAMGAVALAQNEGPGIVPANPLLVNHSKWFDTPKIYDLRAEHFPLKDYPKDLNYEIYSAVGFDLANTIVIKHWDSKGNPEFVIVDTLGNATTSKAAIDAMRAQHILPAGRLPIRAIIYTHNHIDHTYGVWGYLSEADKLPCKPADPEVSGPDNYYDADATTPDCVAVIGQYKINDGVGNTATVTGTIINARSVYMYGNAIPRNRINNGIGPEVKGGVAPMYRMPSRTFNNQLLMKAAGVEMKLIYVPSETNDELSVFVPDGRNTKNAVPRKDDWSGPGLLLSAEVIQGPSFPNLYSLRGTTYRNPADWFRSVDKLRSFDSWCMVPSHGPPLCEPANIQRLLRNFRDAIQFTHDQTIRYINKGYTMSELAPLIEEKYLRSGEHERIMSNLTEVKPIQNALLQVVDPKDYLRPFYGSVVQSVRELYVGSVGWYEADPTALRPTPPKELAVRTVEMMGGGKKINDAARLALDKKEFEWAAELTTNVIRAYLDSRRPEEVALFNEAKQIKADALTKLAELEINPNWRDWYITSAHELRGLPLPKKITGGLVSPGVIGALPAGAWVNSLTMRLRGELTARLGVHKSLGFWFPAKGIGDDQGFGALGYVLVIRDGIAEFIDETPAGQKLSEREVAAAELAISIEKETLDVLLVEEGKGEAEFHSAMQRAYRDGHIKTLHGRIEDFEKAFFEWFEPKPVAVPALTVR